MSNVKNNAKTMHAAMTRQPIPRLLLHLALPTTAGMLITSLQSLVDTLFVAPLGTQATGAVGITFALTALIQAIGFTLGMGGGSLISLCLGKKQVERAGRIASTALLLALISGLCIAACAPWREKLLRLLGATPTILPTASPYSIYLFLAAPLMTTAFCLCHLLRAEGRTAYSLGGIATSGISGIFFDAVLVGPMGIRGIALATLLSQGAGLVVMLVPFFTHKSSLTLQLKKPTDMGSILLNGLPSLLRQGLAAVSAAALSLRAGLYGDSAIAAVSIANKIFMICFTLMLGYGQGLQPFIGFNVSQGQTRRVRQASAFCLITGTIALSLLGALVFWQAPWLVSLFTTDIEVKAVASYALRAGALALPLMPACTIANLGFQAIKRPFLATFLASARQGLFFLPFLFFLPGLWGVQTAQAWADGATFLLSLPFLVYFFRKAVDKKRVKV